MDSKRCFKVWMSMERPTKLNHSRSPARLKRRFNSTSFLFLRYIQKRECVWLYFVHEYEHVTSADGRTMALTCTGGGTSKICRRGRNSGVDSALGYYFFCLQIQVGCEVCLPLIIHLP